MSAFSINYNFPWYRTILQHFVLPLYAGDSGIVFEHLHERNDVAEAYTRAAVSALARGATADYGRHDSSFFQLTIPLTFIASTTTLVSCIFLRYDATKEDRTSHLSRAPEAPGLMEDHVPKDTPLSRNLEIPLSTKMACPRRPLLRAYHPG